MLCCAVCVCVYEFAKDVEMFRVEARASPFSALLLETEARACARVFVRSLCCAARDARAEVLARGRALFAR